MSLVSRFLEANGIPTVVVGSAAALVQALGLARWPFAVPELARRYVAADDGPDGAAARRSVEVVFATLHRLLGVGIGEHLGYLLTGLWTLLVAGSILIMVLFGRYLLPQRNGATMPADFSRHAKTLVEQYGLASGIF